MKCQPRSLYMLALRRPDFACRDCGLVPPRTQLSSSDLSSKAVDWVNQPASKSLAFKTYIFGLPAWIWLSIKFLKLRKYLSNSLEAETINDV